MNRSLPVLLVWLFVFSSSYAKTLTVASWNVHNYFVTDRHVHGKYRPDYPKPEREKAALRAQIHEFAPDILLLQEIGGESALNELLHDLGNEGLEYPYWAILERDGQDRCLAVISREVFVSVRLLDNLSFAYKGEGRTLLRGLMVLEFEANGIPWHVFNLHLKSRRDEKGDYESRKLRTEEAEVIRDFIRHNYLHNDACFLIMGDFNAHVREPAMRRFLTVSGEALFPEIPLWDDYGLNWTHHYVPERIYQQIDYALASPALLSKDSPIWVKQGHIAPKTEGSDHRMIRVILEVQTP